MTRDEILAKASLDAAEEITSWEWVDGRPPRTRGGVAEAFAKLILPHMAPLLEGHEGKSPVELGEGDPSFLNLVNRLRAHASGKPRWDLFALELGDSIEAAEQAARREALEEAAKIVARWARTEDLGRGYPYTQMKKEVRALIDKGK